MRGVLSAAVAGAALLAAGCAPAGPQYRHFSTMQGAELQDAYACAAQARAAGAAATGPNLAWQMAAQGETERDVYTYCMIGKGRDPFVR